MERNQNNQTGLRLQVGSKGPREAQGKDLFPHRLSNSIKLRSESSPDATLAGSRDRALETCKAEPRLVVLELVD